MKNALLLLLKAGVCCTLMVGVLCTTQGESFIYRFSGEVSEIIKDDAGLIGAGSFGLGASVEYTFLVDLDRPGTVTHYDGSVEVLQDIPQPGEIGNLNAHFFHAERVSGSLMVDPAAENLRPVNGTLLTQHGMSSSDPGGSLGTVVQGGVHYRLSIYQRSFSGVITEPGWGDVFGSPLVPEWEVGEKMIAFNSAMNAAGLESMYYAQVTLNEITAVPEPGIMALGMAGVCLWVMGRIGKGMTRCAIREQRISRQDSFYLAYCGCETSRE